MKLNNISKSELELLSYTEIAKMYLTENQTTKNTADLFKEICKLLELSDEEYVDKIADFFESLTTSKEFILCNIPSLVTISKFSFVFRVILILLAKERFCLIFSLSRFRNRVFCFQA